MKEIEKEMYFGAKPNIFDKAKELRKNMTYAEKLLWKKLNKKQICDVRFRRQHPINNFIADFYCHKAKLIIEVDGEIHKNQKEYDIGRTAELNKYEIEVIRFTNKKVETDINNVINKINNIVEKRIKNPPWGIWGRK